MCIIVYHERADWVYFLKLMLIILLDMPLKLHRSYSRRALGSLHRSGRRSDGRFPGGVRSCHHGMSGIQPVQRIKGHTYPLCL